MEYKYSIAQNRLQHSALAGGGQTAVQNDGAGVRGSLLCHFTLSPLFHEAHEYFTYLHPHPLFLLTNFQTVCICISHGSWWGDARAAAEPQQAVTMATSSWILMMILPLVVRWSACLQGYFTAAKCEVGFTGSQPRAHIKVWPRQKKVSQLGKEERFHFYFPHTSLESEV